MNYLFQFAIGPVQSFIAQARKTRDLYAGSRLLSALTAVAFDMIEEKCGKVIIPTQKSQSIPNIITAIFENFNAEELKILGKEIKEQILSKLINEYATKAFEKANIDNSLINQIKDAFEKQVEDYFTINWAFVEIKDNDYKKAFDELGRLMGAVKNVRQFKQYPEIGRKCSLSGEQNALIYRGTKESDLPPFAKITKPETSEFLNQAIYIDNNLIDEGEGLSAISFIKRFYPFEESKKGFDSTADIALIKTISDLQNKWKELSEKENQIEDFFSEYLLMFKVSDITQVDGQLLFKENITKKYFTKHGIPIEYNNVLKTLDKIYKFARNQQIPFVKYYAILLFDADNLGKWLSGEYLPDKTKLKDFQKKLSELLLFYAKKAKAYVDGNCYDKIKKGRTVYAGGDDYLGFINLYYLFDVLGFLRKTFKTDVSDAITNEFDIKQEFNFSAGIAIAHYKIPLSEVLNWAREMEKKAKAKSDKNSFGIVVLKHSGEIYQSVLPFYYRNDFYPEILNKILQKIQSNIFSTNFIKVLNKELYIFTKIEPGLKVYAAKQITIHEIKRTLERSLSKQVVKEEKIQEIREMSQLIEKIYNEEGETLNFLQTLSIIDFINRKLNGNE